MELVSGFWSLLCSRLGLIARGRLYGVRVSVWLPSVFFELDLIWQTLIDYV